MEKLKIELIDDRMKKPFLGGYRNPSKEKEYHHATVMTNFLPKSHVLQDVLIERTTQTIWSEKSRLLDTAVTVSTQTPVKGLHLLEEKHLFLNPRPFTEVKDNSKEILIIQRWWRRWLKRKQILIYLEGVRKRKEKWDMEIQKIQAEKEELRVKLELPIDSMISDEEFDHAYSMIELEKKHLIQKAKANYRGHLLTLAYLYVILQEIGLINKIEHRRRLIKEEKKLRKCHIILKQLSKPRSWIGKNGNLLSIETNLEQEFNKWQDIYKKLTKDNQNVEQRKEVLGITYDTLESNGHEDVQHLKEMITKELKLLNVGVQVKSLEMLHKLIELHLFDHLESYALKFRPELQEMRLSQLKYRLNTCVKCGKVKPEDCFHVYTKTKALDKCKNCIRHENISRKRIDFTVYSFILKALRRNEVQRCCSTPTVFIMQVEDIYDLINAIWQARSILSNKAVIADLCLCRFDNSVDWSPWNCLLLTYEETITHSLVVNPYEIYGKYLIELIKSKHKMAREHFKFLHTISNKHAKTENWLNIKKARPDMYYGIKHPKLSYVCQPSSNIKLFKSKAKPLILN